MQGRNGQRSLVTPAWVSEEGPANDVVLSTRARLARNVQGCPFPMQARDADLKHVADLVLDAVRQSDGPREMHKLRVIQPSHLSVFERLELVDAQVASRQHVEGGRYRPIVLNGAGTLSLMVNEEDHLRIQCILPGLQPMTALQMAQEFDSFLGTKIEYAQTDNYGYLTCSLANIGTGLRLSVMLHLAGLSFLEEAVPALTAAAELKISVRGLFGEGTKAFGDIFQVSNETTIGFSAKEITSRVRAAAEHLISREREARRKLAAERADELRDSVEQSRARLMDARMLGGREAMAYLSMLRLGGVLGVCPSLSAKAFNELLVSMKLGTSARGGVDSGKQAESVTDEVKRARLVREKLIEEYDSPQLIFDEQTEPES